MTPFHHKENGSTSIIAVLMGSFVLFTFLYANWSRTNMKTKEIALRSAKAAAEQSNIAALSYVHASLHHDFHEPPLLEAQGEQFKGNGNAWLSTSGGDAMFERPALANAPSNEATKKLVQGKELKSANAKEKTRLEILDAKKKGHTWIYVVKATTDAKQNGKSLAKISTLARMSVTLPEPDVPGIKTFTECDECLKGADKLTEQLNFKADITKTYNLGHYKVQKSTNLCDIHFMQNMADTIEDHDGTTSVLTNQVALYCPCECKWGEGK